MKIPAPPQSCGHHRTWDDPVEVPVLHLLIELVLVDVEVTKVQKPEGEGLLHGSEAVLQGEGEGAGAIGGISERDVGRYVGGQRTIGVLGGEMVVDDLGEGERAGGKERGRERERGHRYTGNKN